MSTLTYSWLAVAAGRAEEAAELARDHVRRFNRYMEKKKREIGT